MNERAKDPLTSIISGFVFPLHETLKGHDSVRVLRGMERSQWLPPEELSALRVARLRRFLATIGETVPYYRELFARLPFDPASVSGLADLTRLPTMGKAEIRANAERMKRPGARLRSMSTGGSTGSPLRFFLSAERISHDVAAKWRATRWWGVDIGDPEIVLWGSPIELGRQDRARLWRDRIIRSTLLPAFEMSNDRVKGYLAEIERRRPRMLFGYPSALAHLASAAIRERRSFRGRGIRVAFVTGEVLYPEQRRVIEEGFGCRVANGYGGRDAGFIAHECPSGGMHLTAEDVIVELLGEDGAPVPDGTRGEIAVTHLATADFPFLRYRTGDMATAAAGDCPCGRTLPRLAAIEGRRTDFVVAADGTVMHGLSLIYVMRELPEIEAFRIVQESLDRTRVEVVTAGELSEGTRRTIEAGFRARLGAGVRIDVERVAAIAAAASGKYRYVESRVAPPAG
ncbi:MAG TPA: AMP-binding protein [Candidatus Eisenbacteria bacterium]|nr:AMP-binding protein [Candidatus Eisenbacteria bacterium]